MSIKSKYFQLDKKDFNDYLNDLKNSSNTISILDGKFFYNHSLEISNKIISLHTSFIYLYYLILSFSSRGRYEILKSLLIDEIQSTDEIENIYSTKQDIFSCLNNIDKNINNNNNKIISIVRGYKNLLNNKPKEIKTLKDIRNIYDQIITDSVDISNLPDGTYFRKNNVYITDGIKSIHSGINNEDIINKYMNEFINIYNSNNDVFIKMILCHFIFEYVHPYYDGNGRLGRYLFTNGLLLENNIYSGLTISRAFSKEKNKYYKAFKVATSRYEFGCLNSYVITILDILIKETNNLIKELENKKETISLITDDLDMTNVEKRIYKFIKEMSLFSYVGVSNEEIMKETKVSKRSLINVIKKFKNNNMIKITKIGKYNYYLVVDTNTSK